MVGMLAGAYIWGHLGDAKGRLWAFKLIMIFKLISGIGLIFS